METQIYPGIASASINGAPPIEQVVQRLTIEAESLSTSLADLYTRLHPFLADIPPTNVNTTKPPRGIGSSVLVCRLFTIVDRLQEMHDALQSIKDRLEV